MYLPHSDGIFVKAYPAETTEALLDGVASGFSFFGGAAQSVLLDNPAGRDAGADGGVHAAHQPLCVQGSLRSKAVAILVSKHGIGNTQRYERELALIRQTADSSFLVIPVLMPGCGSLA
jgi:hypothetical protein